MYIIKMGTDTHIIATGGTTGDFSGLLSLKSTEIFSMKSQQWIYGPDLPLTITAHSMVTIMNKAYVIGGMLLDTVPATPLSKIYEFHEEMKQHLSISRYYMTTLAIPDDLLS